MDTTDKTLNREYRCAKCRSKVRIKMNYDDDFKMWYFERAYCPKCDKRIQDVLIIDIGDKGKWKQKKQMRMP
jgi:hypothetical protein